MGFMARMRVPCFVDRALRRVWPARKIKGITSSRRNSITVVHDKIGHVGLEGKPPVRPRHLRSGWPRLGGAWPTVGATQATSRAAWSGSFCAEVAAPAFAAGGPVGFLQTGAAPLWRRPVREVRTRGRPAGSRRPHHPGRSGPTGRPAWRRRPRPPSNGGALSRPRSAPPRRSRRDSSRYPGISTARPGHRPCYGSPTEVRSAQPVSPGTAVPADPGRYQPRVDPGRSGSSPPATGIPDAGRIPDGPSLRRVGSPPGPGRRRAYPPGPPVGPGGHPAPTR